MARGWTVSFMSDVLIPLLKHEAAWARGSWEGGSVGEVRLPVTFDPGHEGIGQCYVVQCRSLLLTFFQRPFEEVESGLALLGVLRLLVHDDPGGRRDRPRVLARCVGHDQVEVLGVGPIGDR